MADVSELRELGIEDLRRKVDDLDEQVFRLRIQRSMGKTDAPNKMRELRRERARVKTVIRELELSAAAQGDSDGQ